MRRRNFLATPLAGFPLAAAAAGGPAQRVYATGDGIPHSPEEYARLLATLTAGGKIGVDDYSRGGIVEQLETRMAALLGKEAAVWLPTGTLANQLAVRILAGGRRRVLVQAESHLYKDCGDCARCSAGEHGTAGRGTRNLYSGRSGEAAGDAASGRVVTPIGAIQIESPVRRRQGERFDFAADAKDHGLGAIPGYRPASGWRAAVPGKRLYASVR